MFIQVFEQESNLPVVINLKDVNYARATVGYRNECDVDIDIIFTTGYGSFETEGISGIETPYELDEYPMAKIDIERLYNCALAYLLNNFDKEDVMFASAIEMRVDDVICEIAKELIYKLGY